MTAICKRNIRVLAAGRAACWQQAELPVLWLCIPLDTRENLNGFKPTAVMHFQEKHQLWALYITATATKWATFLHHGLIHGQSTPIRLPVHCTPPYTHTPAPFIHWWSWLKARIKWITHRVRYRFPAVEFILQHNSSWRTAGLLPRCDEGTSSARITMLVDSDILHILITSAWL